jgi:hypothetical protein
MSQYIKPQIITRITERRSRASTGGRIGQHFKGLSGQEVAGGVCYDPGNVRA